MLGVMVVLALLVVGGVGVAVVLMTRSAADAPGRVVAGLLEAVTTREIETTFRAEFSKIDAEPRLQVATLDQSEHFRLRDSLNSEYVSGGEVIVEARVPVQFVYYVSLEQPWMFEELAGGGRGVRVRVPELSWNQPGVDPSKVEYRIAQASWIRREGPVLQRLQASLGSHIASAARENQSLVRETARRTIENFVRDWLNDRYPTAVTGRVDVVFADEDVDHGDTENTEIGRGK